MAGAIALCVCCAAVASAQATRTWVSGVGDDANPCSRSAPCKTFAGAISKTAARGEIDVLDPGGFGAVTITKSITINGGGFVVGVLVSGTNGIIINAADADVVILRGLSFVGLGTGLDAIKFLNGKQLIVENSTISDFTLNGINMSISAGKTGALTVKDTNIQGCGLSGINFDLNGTLQGTLDNVRIENSGTGVSATSGVLRLINCNIAFNTTGIAASGGGVVASFGNNKIAGNTTNGAPTLLLAQQ